MDVWSIAAEWPQADDGQRSTWIQQVRFDITLNGDDVPALVALYRTVIETGGAMQRSMEEALLTALSRIGHVDAVPLFEELLAGSLQGVSPIAEVVEALAEVAGRSGDEHALSLLASCLDHVHVDVRDMATTSVVRAYRTAQRSVPRSVVQQLYALLHHDPTRRVRFSAGLALQELGELDLIEVIFWAEDMAGWEEDAAWGIEDEDWEDVSLLSFDDDMRWTDRLSS